MVCTTNSIWGACLWAPSTKAKKLRSVIGVPSRGSGFTPNIARMNRVELGWKLSPPSFEKDFHMSKVIVKIVGMT